MRDATHRIETGLHRSGTLRLSGYDYTRAGAYFITICVACRQEPFFGQIRHNIMALSTYGRVARDEWIKTGVIRPNMIMDEFVIMPDHMHGIIQLTNDVGTHGSRRTARRAPTTDVQKPVMDAVPLTPVHEQFGKPVPGSIPTIIRSYKSAVTGRINALRQTPGLKVWQRNYYEHVIRHERALYHIRKYIRNHPRMS